MSDEQTNAAMAVLEAVMERAIDEAVAANMNGNAERLQAFFEVLDWAKTQAEVMDLPPFANRSLNDLDPYSLLAPSRKAA